MLVHKWEMVEMIKLSSPTTESNTIQYNYETPTERQIRGT